MMPSMYTAVSGLRSMQTKLDVISNNVANANTVGYKSQAVNFSDVLNETISNASAPDSSGSYGGTNPKQFGLGVSVGAVTTNTATGSLQSTGSSTDLAIDGEGYFTVKDSDGALSYTRGGNFGIDSSGNLVTSDGKLVCGWNKYTTNSDGTYSYDTTTTPTGINVYSDSTNGNKQSLSPVATTKETLTGNLNSSETAQGTAATTIGTSPTSQYTTTSTVYDSLGNAHTAYAKYTKCYTDSTTNNSTWYYEVTCADSSATTNNTGYLEFDSNGALVTTDTTTYPTSCSPTFAFSGASSSTVKYDFSNLTQYSSDSTASVLSSDGKAGSTLTSYSIGQDGVISGVYASGAKQPLGCISLVRFSNPGGLERTGNNQFKSTANSGAATNVYQPGTGGSGTLKSGYLEMSNVDLANEFSEMIVAQRAYQANSKVITTADEMLQILMSMKS